MISTNVGNHILIFLTRFFLVKKYFSLLIVMKVMKNLLCYISKKIKKNSLECLLKMSSIYICGENSFEIFPKKLFEKKKL